MSHQHFAKQLSSLLFTRHNWSLGIGVPGTALAASCMPPSVPEIATSRVERSCHKTTLMTHPPAVPFLGSCRSCLYYWGSSVGQRVRSCSARGWLLAWLNQWTNYVILRASWSKMGCKPSGRGMRASRAWTCYNLR